MLLKINSLLIKRGNKILISDFNLIIQKSQIIAISGSNGIGKSTLLETISGLQKNYDGEINFFIQDKINEGLNRSSFFFLGHLNALKDELCVLDNLKIQDLTGAGDLFAAGFLLGYIKNKDLEYCGNEGVNFASKIIQIYGARL